MFSQVSVGMGFVCGLSGSRAWCSGLASPREVVTVRDLPRVSCAAPCFRLEDGGWRCEVPRVGSLTLGRGELSCGPTTACVLDSAPHELRCASIGVPLLDVEPAVVVESASTAGSDVTRITMSSGQVFGQSSDGGVWAWEYWPRTDRELGLVGPTPTRVLAELGGSWPLFGTLDLDGPSLGTGGGCIEFGSRIRCYISQLPAGIAGHSVEAAPGEFTSLSGGTGLLCGLRGNGTVRCWGARSAGRAARVHDWGGWEVEAPCEVTAVSSDRGTGCVVCDSGSVYCWGANDSRQIDPVCDSSWCTLGRWALPPLTEPR
jgi:hypothetical protein